MDHKDSQKVLDAAQPAGDSGGKSPVTGNTGNPADSHNSPVETATATAKEVFGTVKDTAGQAYGLAAEKATAKIEEHKSNLSSGLSGIADSIREVGKNLSAGKEQNVVTEAAAKYGESIAAKIEGASGYFEKQDLKAIVRDLEFFARRQPAVFIGASFVAGLLAARFLKSSGSAHSITSSAKNSGGSQPNSDTQQSNNQDKQVGQASANRS